MYEGILQMQTWLGNLLHVNLDYNMTTSHYGVLLCELTHKLVHSCSRDLNVCWPPQCEPN